MTTKKFNAFEYAAHTESGKPENVGVHCQDIFETPHGHAFVVVTDHNPAEDQPSKLCKVVMLRIRYYMEHEPEERNEDVTKNALIYTSGYVYQYHKKEGTATRGVSCLCLLYSDEQVFYSWIGDVGLYLFTGKRLHWLTWHAKTLADGSKDEPGQKPKPVLLGEQPIIEPMTNSQDALKPVNGDKLILSAGNVGKCIHTRATKRILKDSMPLQTKVTRILRHPYPDAEPQSGALILLRFHAVSHKERIISTELKDPTPHQSQQTEEMKQGETKKKPKKKSVNLLKLVLLAIGLLAVLYFVYDLFIYDPRPPVSITVPQHEAGPEESVHVPDEVADELTEEVAETFTLPADIPYTVRTGDTWGRIYSQFGVCSWFIRNHPPNTGRFGSQGSLMAGQRLQIPVKYSADPQLNPHFYTEFTTDKVGSGCQNVDRAFLKAFEERVAN